jgi:hypothetical protein
MLSNENLLPAKGLDIQNQRMRIIRDIRDKTTPKLLQINFARKNLTMAATNRRQIHNALYSIVLPVQAFLKTIPKFLQPKTSKKSLESKQT